MVCRPAHSTVHAARHQGFALPISTGVALDLTCPLGSLCRNEDLPVAVWLWWATASALRYQIL